MADLADCGNDLVAGVAGDLSRGAIGGLWRFIAEELRICEGASTRK